MTTNYRVENTKDVSKFLEKGWQLHGSPFVIGSAAFQALVLRSPATATEAMAVK